MIAATNSAPRVACMRWPRSLLNQRRAATRRSTKASLGPERRRLLVRIAGWALAVIILAGVVVSVVSSRSLLESATGGNGALATSISVVGVTLLLAAPVVVPALAPLAARLTGKSLPKATLPVRAVVYAMIGNVVAWL